VDLGDGAYELRLLSDKGSMLFCGRTETSDRVGAVGQGPEPSIDRRAIQRFLADGFESPEWPAVSLRCLGCGACAYTCPTCHCFDIVDEGVAGSGIRARNWDACQFPMFTMHASGHNPRSGQAQRQRQRIFHKFKIYPDKFGEILCTGCGNCTRNCPVSLGVRPVLAKFSEFA
jgi:ferredoxin